jgi:hypothetical protein
VCHGQNIVFVLIEGVGHQATMDLFY